MRYIPLDSLDKRPPARGWGDASQITQFTRFYNQPKIWTSANTHDDLERWLKRIKPEHAMNKQQLSLIEQGGSMCEPVLKLEHADARGEIYSITLPGDKELILLHSKAGTLRGGHAHDVDETVMLLTGKMAYHKKRGEYGPEEMWVLRDGDASFNQGSNRGGGAGEYHTGEFLEDSWLLEWKIGTSKGKWVNVDYAPWRERVNANASREVVA
jgi:hypothetical protein